MNCVWIGYGSLDRIYNHSGRPTKEILECLSMGKKQVMFVEGIIGPKSKISALTQNKNILILCSTETLEKRAIRHRKTFYENQAYLIQERVKQVFNDVVDLVIVDSILMLGIAHRIAEMNQCPIFFRLYGVWDKPERNHIVNSGFSARGIKRFLRSRRIFRFLSSMSAGGYIKRIVVTDDGSRGVQYLQKLSGVRRGDVELCSIKNNHSVDLIDYPDFGIRNDSVVELLYISRMEKGKRSDIPVKAMRTIKDTKPDLFERIRLNYVGEGSYLEEIIRLSERLEVTNSIQFHGYLPRPMLKKAIPIVTTSICVNSYNPVLESLSAGIPVIANDWGACENLYRRVQGIDLVGREFRKLLLSPSEERELVRQMSVSIMKGCEFILGKSKPELTEYSNTIVKSLVENFPSIERKVEIECNIISSCIRNRSNEISKI